jgi:hypothetical protein
MAFVSSNLLLFSVDLILGDKEKSGGDKSGKYGGGWNYGIFCFAKICFIDAAV